MAERVVAIDLGITWDPNAPDAVLVSNDNGSTVLAMRASDASQRESCLLLIWSGARFAAMTPPNDEAIFGHRLYSTGLADVLWAGVVHDSQLVSELEQRNRVHASHDPTRFQELTHHVIRTKECVIEVVAEALDVSQASGPTALAAANAITS